MPDEVTTQDPPNTGDEPGNNSGGANGAPAVDNGVPAPEPAPAPKPAPAVVPQRPAGGGDDERPIFTQSDLDRHVQTRLAEEKTRQQRAAQAEKDRAEQARLREQGEFKLLLEQTEQKVRDLEGQMHKQERDSMVSRVAARHKLPEHWFDRVRGETEEEINADAERLAKDMAPPRAPVPGAGPNGRRDPAAALNDEVKARLGERHYGF